jgi:hypothetical protein
VRAPAPYFVSFCCLAWPAVRLAVLLPLAAGVEAAAALLPFLPVAPEQHHITGA